MSFHTKKMWEIFLLIFIVVLAIFFIAALMNLNSRLTQRLNQLENKIGKLTGGGSGGIGTTGPTGITGGPGEGTSIDFPLSVISGGTSQSSLSNNALLIGQDTGAVGFVGPSSFASAPLISNGIGAAPSFSHGIAAFRIIRSTPIAGNYTIVESDANQTILVDALCDITIPNDATTPFTIGTEIEFIQTNDNQYFTFVADGGVTLRSTYNNLRSLTQGSIVIIKKTQTDTWYLAGSLTTS